MPGVGTIVRSSAPSLANNPHGIYGVSRNLYSGYLAQGSLSEYVRPQLRTSSRLQVELVRPFGCGQSDDEIYPYIRNIYSNVQRSASSCPRSRERGERDESIECTKRLKRSSPSPLATLESPRVSHAKTRNPLHEMCKADLLSADPKHRWAPLAFNPFLSTLRYGFITYTRGLSSVSSPLLFSLGAKSALCLKSHSHDALYTELQCV